MTSRLLIAALCLVGFFVSARMQAKATRAAQGLLDEPSVVQTPRARMIGGTPNSAIGLAYYALVFVAVWFTQTDAVWIAAVVAATLAAAMSLYLAYSLLFVTRMPCVMCWTGHLINWLILALLVAEKPR